MRARNETRNPELLRPAHHGTARISRRRLLGASGLGALGLAAAALIGCGAAGDDEPAPTAAPTPARPTAAPQATATAASSTPQPTATATARASAAASTPAPTATPQAAAPQAAFPDELVIANEIEAPDLLPWLSGFGQMLVTRQVYETLVEPRLTLAADGSPQWEVVGALAESWEQQPDGLDWVFQLRPGVSFHNGEPWTAEAATASYELLASDEVTTELRKFQFLNSAITGMEATDELTVRASTPRPNPEFITLNVRLAFVGMPPSAIAGEGYLDFAEAPLGTGPYRFANWSRGQDIELERFGGYWGELPNMPAVRYIARPEASVRALTVETGEAHFAFNVGIENARSLDAYTVGGGFQSTSIRLNNAKPPTNDIRVRQALNYAVDRTTIIDGILGGAAVPLAFFAFQPVTLDPFPYDPARARALLDAAGATGEELELVYGEFRIPEEELLAQAYKGYFDAVGLNVTLNRIERAVYRDASSAAFEDQPQLLIETTSSGNYFDVEGAFADKYGCEGSGTFCDLDVEALWSNLGVLSGQERIDQIQIAAQTLHEQYTPRVWVAGVQQVHGHAPFVDTSRLPLNVYIQLQDLRFA